MRFRMSFNKFILAAVAGIALLLSACSSENSTSTTEEVIDESSSSTTEKADESSASKGSSSESKDPSANSSSGTAASSSSAAKESSSSMAIEEFQKIIDDILESAQIGGCESIDTTSDKWEINGSFAFEMEGLPSEYTIQIIYDFTTTPATRTITPFLFDIIPGESTTEELKGTKEEIYKTAVETCNAIQKAIDTKDFDSLMSNSDLLDQFGAFQVPSFLQNE